MTARELAIVVVKVGGDVLLEPGRLAGLVANVRDLVAAGFHPVLLHGGGPQVTALQEKVGLVAKKVGGRRVTSPEDLLVVEQAICGQVNVQLVAALVGGGVRAFGCHGASGGMIEAARRPPTVVSGAGPEPVDFGEVGDVVTVHTGGLVALVLHDFVPVVATLGVDASGRVFNINADTTAVQLAAALSADALLLVTGVGAVYRDLDDKGSRIGRITREEAEQLIAEGVIHGGMIPKVEEALSVLGEDGEGAHVGAICIVGPDDEGAFLAAARKTGDRGTVIVGAEG